jgi:hypothetical protein
MYFIGYIEGFNDDDDDEEEEEEEGEEEGEDTAYGYTNDFFLL